MSDVLDIAVDYVASTARWSGKSNWLSLQGTLWYGTMCRSFLLLERLLRTSLIEVKQHAEQEIEQASRRRACGKPLEQMTFGQCLGILQETAAGLPPLLSTVFPNLHIPHDLLPQAVRHDWEHVIRMRNQLAHEGPGFVDSVDLFSGRIWRRYEIETPLDQQAREIWTVGRRICQSAFVVTCVEIQGVDAVTARTKLNEAEKTRFSLDESGSMAEQAITKFHAIKVSET